MATNLIEYLPPIMQDVIQIQEITSSENPEIDDVQEVLSIILVETFIDTASEYGISRMEKIAGIVPKDTDTLDDRRFNLKFVTMSDRPYTMRSLENKLKDLLGVGNYEMSLSDYTLNVKLNLGVKSQFDFVDTILERIVPANLVINLDLLYNTHAILSSFTHGHLATYTHEQLRKDVI